MHHIELDPYDIQALSNRYAYDPKTGIISREGKALRTTQITVPGGRKIYRSRAAYALFTQTDIPPKHIVGFRDDNPNNLQWANLILRKYSDRYTENEGRKRLDQYVDFFRECFDYDPFTGVLMWKTRPLHHFASANAQKAFNSRRAGKEAGTPQGRDKRLQVHFTASTGAPPSAYVHVITWVMSHGKDAPDGYVIDHVDRNARNNALSNLRLATPSENLRNNNRKPGKSGYRGIIERSEGYEAWLRIQRQGQIKVKEKAFFHTLEQALHWRKTKEKQYFGEFSTQNTNCTSAFSQFL
ncbi:HNH endonuclease signature motif containing protein [Paraburkholderia caribensis]|uniref:HNH endonuclease signature motif containing protein n=1 Tax=Paraburkholderia caribensis TaxID=75105 RepID=UPI00078D93F6|nr:HNH endonuclease signature motif containing protein [Paraburkholderia caribensis]AMV42275.1 hypothetical protein ATN79_06230 [Paraburkholderia caribensis]